MNVINNNDKVWRRDEVEDTYKVRRFLFGLLRWDKRIRTESLGHDIVIYLDGSPRKILCYDLKGDLGNDPIELVPKKPNA